MKTYIRIGLLLLVIFLYVAPPLLLKSYTVANLSMVCIYGVALMGIVLLTGYGGQISLGHGAFFALGAYCTAILMTRFGVPYWLTLVPAAMLCFAVGLLFGLPALRLPGHHLALATFALAMAAPQLLKYKGFESWTKGVQGIVLDRPEAPWGLPIGADQWLYLCALTLFLVMYFIAHGLVSGRMGRAILALREHPIAAVSMGIDPARVKSLTFATSTLFTGVAGSAAAICWQFVSPDSFTVFFSLLLLVGAVIGGLSSLPGVVVGAAVMQYLPNVTEQISKSAPTAIYGAVLILAMFAMPAGASGIVRGWAGWLKQHKPQKD